MIRLAYKYVVLVFVCVIIGVGAIAYGRRSKCCKVSRSHCVKSSCRKKSSSNDVDEVLATSMIENVPQKMTLTVSLAPLTICEALRRGAQEFNAKFDAYIPINDKQKEFIATQYIPYVQNKLFDKFSPSELKAYVSDDYKYLNEILRQNDFTIQLKPFAKFSIGVVALQDVVVKWMKEGSKEPIQSDGKEYEGVRLHDHVSFYTKGDDNSLVIAELRTKTDDKVYFVVQRDKELFKDLIEEPTIAQAVTDYHAALHNNTYTLSDHFDGIVFPMIMYTKEPSIGWILRLAIGDRAIAQALQQVIFKMNEKGAQAKAATAVEFELMAAPGSWSSKETLIVDKPFLVWIERSGVLLPIFADYMLKQYWSNPGELPK